jgi:ABC-type iron transport system FetAB ATPase subunit
MYREFNFEEYKMSKPVSPSVLKRNIKALPREKQRESIERGLRVIPQMLLEETGRTDGHYSQKVVKHLEKVLKVYQDCWTDYLIANNVNKETV